MDQATSRVLAGTVGSRLRKCQQKSAETCKFQLISSVWAYPHGTAAIGRGTFASQGGSSVKMTEVQPLSPPPRVLFVDDDPALGPAFKRTIRRFRYEADVARSGAE